MIRLSRKQILALLILCGAVILNVTMWPYNFRFDWQSVSTRLHSAIHLPLTNGGMAEKKDIVLNVILFLPFGALLFLQRAKETTASRSVLIPTLLGMLLSVVIETTQCFLPSRTPSLIDVCTNTLGALLGAIAARILLRIVDQTTDEEARRAFHRNALFLSLVAYSLVLVALTPRSRATWQLFSPFSLKTLIVTISSLRRYFGIGGPRFVHLFPGSIPPHSSALHLRRVVNLRVP